jgi:DNA-binding NtrC family response regulator
MLLDVFLHGAPSYPVLREARMVAPAMKVIVMSGQAKDVARQGLRRDDIPFFLQKPFSVSTLVNLIRHVLGHSTDRSEGTADSPSATLPPRST